MKFFTAILTFYFVFLTGVPTARIVKSLVSECCDVVAEKNKCCQGDEMPEGCQKEKCVLNLNFSAGQFIVQQIQNVSFPLIFETEKKSNLIYEKTFIPEYYKTFWHPPEMNS